MAEAAVRDAPLETLADCQALLLRDGFRPCRPGESATIFGFVCDLKTGALAVSDGDPLDAQWTHLRVPNFEPV